MTKKPKGKNPSTKSKKSPSTLNSQPSTFSQQMLVEKIILITATFNPEAHEVLAPIHFATRHDPPLQDLILQGIAKRVLERVEGHELESDLDLIFCGGIDLDDCADKVYKALGFERLTKVLEQIREDRPGYTFTNLIFGSNN